MNDINALGQMALDMYKCDPKYWDRMYPVDMVVAIHAIIKAQVIESLEGNVVSNDIATVTHDDNTVTVTLSDGTVACLFAHVCPSCTSIDTWVTGDLDPLNRTGDQHRQTVKLVSWDRDGRRTVTDGTTTNHVILKEKS